MHICGSFWVDFGTVSVFSSMVKTGPKRIKKWICFGARFLNDFGGFGGVFSGPNRSPRGVSVWLGAPEAGLSLDRSGCVRPSWGPDRLRTPPRSILDSFLDVFWSIFGPREPSKIHFWSIFGWFLIDFWRILVELSQICADIKTCSEDPKMIPKWIDFFTEIDLIPNPPLTTPSWGLFSKIYVPIYIYIYIHTCIYYSFTYFYRFHIFLKD